MTQREPATDIAGQLLRGCSRLAVSRRSRHLNRTATQRRGYNTARAPYGRVGCALL